MASGRCWRAGRRLAGQPRTSDPGPGSPRGRAGGSRRPASGRRRPWSCDARAALEVRSGRGRPGSCDDRAALEVCSGRRRPWSCSDRTEPDRSMSRTGTSRPTGTASGWSTGPLSPSERTLPVDVLMGRAPERPSAPPAPSAHGRRGLPGSAAHQVLMERSRPRAATRSTAAVPGHAPVEPRAAAGTVPSRTVVLGGHRDEARPPCPAGSVPSTTAVPGGYARRARPAGPTRRLRPRMLEAAR
jgi:hypothetical protein